MSDIAIRVENLGKLYRIGGRRERYRTFRDTLAESLSAPFRAARARRREAEPAGDNTFWALKDVSFEVKRGEVLGIIGRNGAGKSTLLKILSRITEPTEGRVDLYGRVGSLLEVGTGFHPELTGRENVYLNGAILGMKRAEIERRFDEIVAFAEVEKFIDTPVKHYSSGMYLRLAFAVAAHLEPEILLVDEVLAVGDAEFQRKCLGKMGEVANEGRTVLFVSHNMGAVTHLCTQCEVLDHGRVVFSGLPNEAVDSYLGLAAATARRQHSDLMRHRPTWARPYITAARVTDGSGQECSAFPLGSDITFEMQFRAEERPLRRPVMGVDVLHHRFGVVTMVNTRMTGYWPSCEPLDSGTMRCTVRQATFLQGHYTASVWLGDGPENLDTLTEYLHFDILETDVYGTGHPPFPHGGAVFVNPEWELRAAPFDDPSSNPRREDSLERDAVALDRANGRHGRVE